MTERKTKQKQLVPDVLTQAARPLTVPEILALGQEQLPALGAATVYRAIKRLLESGDIQPVVIPGDAPRYEMAKHHHHHFKCNGCETVYDLEGCLAGLRTLVPHGFHAVSHDLTFYGTCRTCA